MCECQSNTPQKILIRYLHNTQKHFNNNYFTPMCAFNRTSSLNLYKSSLDMVPHCMLPYAAETTLDESAAARKFAPFAWLIGVMNMSYRDANSETVISWSCLILQIAKPIRCKTISPSYSSQSIILSMSVNTQRISKKRNVKKTTNTHHKCPNNLKIKITLAAK